MYENSGLGFIETVYDKNEICNSDHVPSTGYSEDKLESLEANIQHS